MKKIALIAVIGMFAFSGTVLAGNGKGKTTQQTKHETAKDTKKPVKTKKMVKKTTNGTTTETKKMNSSK